MTDVTRSVGRYDILREIGRGGMARVYLARQSDLDRLVALKELSAFHASDPQFAQRSPGYDLLIRRQPGSPLSPLSSQLVLW